MKTKQLLTLVALWFPLVAFPAQRVVLSTGASLQREIKRAEITVARTGKVDTVFLQKGIHSVVGNAVVSESICLIGDTLDPLTVSVRPYYNTEGGAPHRVMLIRNLTKQIHVTLRGLTITSGNASYDDLYPGKGGGIYNFGDTLTIENVRIIGNIASSDSLSVASVGWGGGIYNGEGGTTLVRYSYIGDNFAKNKGRDGAGYGGGIYNAQGSILKVFNSSVQNNIAVQGQRQVGYGGGLANFGDTLLIEHSDVTYNYANYSTIFFESDTVTGFGGGIYNDGTATKQAVLKLLGSTMLAATSSMRIKMNIAAYVFGNVNYKKAYGYGGGIANGVNGRIFYTGETLITGNYALGNQHPAVPASGEGYGGGMYQYQERGNGDNSAYWYPDPDSEASKDTLSITGNLAADTLTVGGILPPISYGHEIWVGNLLPPSQQFTIYCDDENSVEIMKIFQFYDNWHWGINSGANGNVLTFRLPFPYNYLQPQISVAGDDYLDMQPDENDVYRYRLLSNGEEGTVRVDLRVKSYYKIPVHVIGQGLTFVSGDGVLPYGKKDTVYVTEEGQFGFALQVDESFRGLTPAVTYGRRGITSQPHEDGSFYYSLSAKSDEDVICAWDEDGQLNLVRVEFKFIGEASSHISLVSKAYGDPPGDTPIEFEGISFYMPKNNTLTFRLQVNYPYHEIIPVVLLEGSNEVVSGESVGGTIGIYKYQQKNIARNMSFLIKNEYKTIVLPEPPRGFFISSPHATGKHYIHSDVAFSFTLKPADVAMDNFLKKNSDLWPETRSSTLDPVLVSQGTYVLPKGKDHILTFEAKHRTIHLPDRLPSGVELMLEEGVTWGNNYCRVGGIFRFKLKLNSFPDYHYRPKVAIDGYEQSGSFDAQNNILLYSIEDITKDVNVTIDRHIVVVRAGEEIELLSHQHPCDTFQTANEEFIIEFRRTHDYLTPRVTVQNGKVITLTEGANNIFYCTIKAGESFNDNVTGIHIKAEGSTAFDLLCPSGIELVYTSVDPIQGAYCVSENSLFTFKLKIKELYQDAVPVVFYGGNKLTGTKDGLVWTYNITVARDAEIKIELDYVEIRFDIFSAMELLGLKKESNLLRRDSIYKFSIEAYRPYHDRQPIIDSDQVKYVSESQEVPGFMTVYNYELTVKEDAVIKIHANYQTIFFHMSSTELTVRDNKGRDLRSGDSITVSEKDGSTFYVTVPSKYGSALPGVIFNSALIQPIDKPVLDEGGLKYPYVVTAKRNGTVNIGLNCAKVVFSGLGNSISLQSPAPADTQYVTPGTMFKFRLKVDPLYKSIVPAVKVSPTGEYLVPEETSIDGLYDFSVPVGNGLISIDAKLSSYKVILSVLNPESIELEGGQNIFYFPQATEDSPNVLVFTIKVKDGFEYVSPRVTIGSTRLRVISRDKEKYTYILGNIRENLLVDIQMVYARLKFTLSNGVELVNTGQSIRPDGYYYLHTDSTFTFSLRAPDGSPNAAPAIVAGDEALLPRSLGGGVFAYAFKVKSGDTEIKVSPYREITFGNDIPADITLRSHRQGIYYAPLGSRFEFTLEVKSSYKNVVPNVTVEGNAGVQVQLIDRDDAKNIYNFAMEVKDNATLHFSLQTLTLRFAALPEGIVFINDPGPFAQVKADSVFTFAVQVDKAHSSIQPYVSAGGNSVTLVSVNESDHIYTYTVTTSKSATVFVSLSATTVFLSAELPKGLELAGNNGEGTYHLSYGQPFSFSVRKSSTLDVHVRPTAHARTEERTWNISPVVNGEYFNFTLQEVTTNTEILVDVNYRTLTIPVPANDLILIYPTAGTRDVATGDTFKFSLKAVNNTYAYVPPTVTSKNKVSYTFDEATGVYNYTLTALYDDAISIKLNYVAVTVDLASEEIALVSPTGLLYGKQIVYAPMGGNCTLNFQLSEYTEIKTSPTIVVDQVKLLPPTDITEVSANVYETTLPQLTGDKYIKVLIPRLSSTNQIDISFIIADGIMVSLAGYEYRSTARHTIYKGNFCQFFFQTDEPYLDAEVALLINGALYDFTTLGGGNYAVNLGSVVFNTNIQILRAANKNTTFPSVAKVKITTQGNDVTVESEDEVPVSVYTLTGQMRFQRKIQGTDTFTLPTGIYVLRVGNEVFKLRLSSR
ncbi:MAG: hypothetical protein LBU03_03890 [Tannerellaceae bacterium]|jgi:hypothetical protein|nr:hypothetical protein [Tannerellaceae bacterium]